MRRLTALLLAFACLWISGGATLHHTDDIASFLTFHTTGSAFSHSAAQSPDLCLACQWENAAFDSQVPVVPSVQPIFVLLPVLAISPELHPSIAFNHASPRAPPALI